MHRSAETIGLIAALVVITLGAMIFLWKQGTREAMNADLERSMQQLKNNFDGIDPAVPPGPKDTPQHINP